MSFMNERDNMKEQTNLLKAIRATDQAAQYDANVKWLLADKQVLARILKYTVWEFTDMKITEIIDCIGDKIEIGKRFVEPGLSNIGKVFQDITEDNIPGEGAIFYDIRFKVYHRKREMVFLINVEAQRTSKAYKLGYHLENRIIFYLARMISAQKETEFYNGDYDSLKPVVSIWICMDAENGQESIEEIYMNSRSVFGVAQGIGNTDLIRGIIVRIRNNVDVKASKNSLIAMLEVLLSNQRVEEKKKILETDYNMIMTTEMEGRMQNMCNLSEIIIERGIEQGIERGMERGIEQGIERGIRALILDNLEDGKTREQIIPKLVKRFELDLESANSYFEKYKE